MLNCDLGLIAAIVAGVVLLAVTSAEAAKSSLRPNELRCEYRNNPLGIDSPQPRLSWIVESTRRGQLQTAYQVLVASTAAGIEKDKGDLWDSGKVASDLSCQIAYAGKPLKSGVRCYWKVRVWDNDGQPSTWSESAMWSMGLLEPSDWKAGWIGYDPPQNDLTKPAEDPSLMSLEGSKWVWYPEGNPVEEAPREDIFLRRAFDVPADRKVRLAFFLGTADDAFTLTVNGYQIGKSEDRQESWRALHKLDVSKQLAPSRNLIALHASNTSTSPAGLIGKLVIQFETGSPLIIPVDSTWKVSKESQQGWEKAGFDDSRWTAAREMVEFGGGPWGQPAIGGQALPPAPFLRKSFSADKPIARATLYVSATGLYEMHINGKRVGDDYFTPGDMEFRKRVYYLTYDVTKMLKQGENAIGGILGDGWYAGYLAFTGRRNWYGGKPAMLAQLDIEYTDGSKEVIATDQSWKGQYGPILYADMLMGCAYDARKEMPGWDTAGFDDSAWRNVIIRKQPSIKIEAKPDEPVRRFEQIAASKVTQPTPGAYVFDLKQNMVGWARLRVKGKPGQKIVVRHAEMLNPDGTIYTTNLRAAKCTETYYLKGNGEEVLEPYFTFHGFQYVEVTGLESEPTPNMVTGIVVNSDMPRTGTFECSSPLVNQLFHNIIWGQKGNYIEIPTDCPQRDERAGWTGDAQFFIPTAAFNFDVSAFFTKWLVDLAQDSQASDGGFADVAPDLDLGHGNTAWGDAAVICTYRIYQVYGDTRIIERHYDALSRYMDFLLKTSADYVRDQGAYGDWLNLGGGAKSEVVGTAYFAYDARIMSEMAAAIGREEDAKRYAEMADKITETFRRRFVAADGTIQDSSQTGYALAFTMDLLPGEVRAKAADLFVDDIKRRNWRLATGFIGTPRLLPALTAAGRADVAHKLLLQEAYPSWLFQVKLGATTMWERWDGWTPDKGFQDAGMNSFNHYAFGSVGEYLYTTVAGIDTDGPGFRRIIIRPQPGGGLTYAKATYRSIHGLISSDWKTEDGDLTLKVTIPANTTATVYVPATDSSAVTEGGKPVGQTEGVRFLRMENGAATYSVGSGSYTFVSHGQSK